MCIHRRWHHTIMYAVLLSMLLLMVPGNLLDWSTFVGMYTLIMNQGIKICTILVCCRMLCYGQQIFSTKISVPKLLLKVKQLSTG